MTRYRMIPCSGGGRHDWYEEERSFDFDGPYYARRCYRCQLWFDEARQIVPCDWCDDPQPGWVLVDGWHISPEDEYGLEPRARVPCARRRQR